jgi:hypothetical protein
MNLHTVSVVIILSMPFVALTLWALVDASRREFDSLGRKVVWMMVAAIPFVGFLIYFLFGRKQGKKTA